MPEQGKAIRVLLVEDSPDYDRILRRAMRRTRLLEELYVVDDGDQAMEFLRREGEYAEAPRPDLILLDLNLPRKDGWEVLREIKAEKHLKGIPVVVLTTSDADADVRRAYQLQASCFITKPADFNELERLMIGLGEFWTAVACLPAVPQQRTGRPESRP
jgi:CheY-like chemotaxis protein